MNLTPILFVGEVVTISLVLLAVGVVFSIVGMLLTPKPKTDQGDPAAKTALADKGSILQYVMGEMLVFPAFVTVFDRFTEKEKPPGGKGFGGGGASLQNVYYERAVHALAVNGPASRLRTIRQDGKILWQGDISRDGSPSGTTHSLSNKQSFTIYWGELDQIITDTRLSSADAFGVNSGYPNMVLIFWNPKRLGGSAAWPNLSYELSVPVRDEFALTQSAAWLEDVSKTEFWADNVTALAKGLNLNLAVYTEEIKAPNNKVKKTYFNSTNNINSGYAVAVTSTAPSYLGTRTLEVSARPGRETGVAVQGVNNSGPNPAHVLMQLLTAPMPHGVGVPLDQIDLPAMEVLGILMASEGQTANFILENGPSAADAIGQLMADMSVTIPLINGKLTPKALRPSDTPIQVPADDLVGTLPERTFTVGPRQVDRTIFTFIDREENYKRGDLVIDADVYAFDNNSFNMQSVSLKTINNGWAATQIATRRQLEEYAAINTYKLEVQGTSRDVIEPGDLIQVDGATNKLRVLSVAKSPLDPKARIEAIDDPYSVANSFIEGYITQSVSVLNLAENDRFIDIMPVWVTEKKIGFWMFRNKANSSIVKTDLYISSDNISYEILSLEYSNSETFMQLLDGSIPSTDNFISLSPVFTYYGDISKFNDLSSASDRERWLSGSQAALIGTELFYFQKIIPVSTTTARFSGLARSQKGTTQNTHPIGTSGWIFTPADMTVFQSEFYSPNRTNWIKSLTQSFDTQLDLTTSDSFENLPDSSQMLVPGVSNLHVNPIVGQPNNTYITGGAVAVRFSYRLLNDLNVAGVQLAGETSSKDFPDVQGSFFLRLSDGVNQVNQTLAQDAAQSQILTSIYNTKGFLEVIFTNALLISVFGVEPANLTLTVSSTVGRYTSSENSINVRLI